LNIKSNRVCKGRKKSEEKGPKERGSGPDGWAQMGKIQEKVGPKAKHV